MWMYKRGIRLILTLLGYSFAYSQGMRSEVFVDFPADCSRMEAGHKDNPAQLTPTVADTCKPFVMAAFRTNALYDLLLVPNLGIEFYAGKNYTVGLNGMGAWWKCERKDYMWRIYGAEVFARKYFGKKADERTFTGHHLGLYGQILTYDFQLGGKGIMGGIPGGNIFEKMNYGIGIEYGYALPIAKQLNLDFSLGLGYLGGEYREYRPMDDHNVWQATKKRHWFGPTKAEISLVWVVPAGQKGGTR